MSLTVLRFLAVLFTAVAMAAGFAHLLELPNKISLNREEYLTVQQIYRGWALLGFAVVGAWPDSWLDWRRQLARSPPTACREPAYIGSNRSSSRRSALPSGPLTASSGTRGSWGCGTTRDRKRSCGRIENGPGGSARSN